MAGARKVRTVSEVKSQLHAIEESARGRMHRGPWGLFGWVSGFTAMRRRDAEILRWFLGEMRPDDKPGWAFTPQDMRDDEERRALAEGEHCTEEQDSECLQVVPIRPATMATCLKDGPNTPRPELPKGQPS